MCILATDLERSPEPFAVLTGDTLFIGDVGRPDLAENRTSQELAGMLYRSLHQKLLTLPDAYFAATGRRGHSRHSTGRAVRGGPHPR